MGCILQGRARAARGRRARRRARTLCSRLGVPPSPSTEESHEVVRGWKALALGARATLTAMAEPARKLATYEDVLNAPEHVIAQVVDGELHVQPRPAKRHARSASRLGGDLDGPFDCGRGGPGGWLILDEPELHLGPQPQILVPDLAGWRRERMPVIGDGAFFDVVPDWVCEVLSPSTGAFDCGRKADVYAELSVKYMWLVDPEIPQIEAFENVGGRWLRLGAYDQRRAHRALRRGAPRRALARGRPRAEGVSLLKKA